MKEQDPLRALRALLDSVRVGVMCTIGENGDPRCRWMTAATLPRVQDCFYCVTGTGSGKVKEIQKTGRVHWTFQTPALDEIISVCGRAEVLEHPAMKAEVLEALGPNLMTFWRVNPDPAKLVVIETTVEKAQLFRPMECLYVDKEVGRE